MRLRSLSRARLLQELKALRNDSEGQARNDGICLLFTSSCKGLVCDMKNIKPIILISLFIFLSFVFLATASDITVTATVDKTETTMDDQITLSVSVNGAQRIGDPVLPPLQDFQVISSGTSSEVKIINGSLSAFKSFNYILLPQKEGEFTIGQVQVEIQNKIYKTTQ